MEEESTLENKNDTDDSDDKDDYAPDAGSVMSKQELLEMSGMTCSPKRRRRIKEKAEIWLPKECIEGASSRNLMKGLEIDMVNANFSRSGPFLTRATFTFRAKTAPLKMALTA